MGKVEGERWLFGEEDSDLGVERGLAIDRGRARDCEVESSGDEEGVARGGRVARACGVARLRSPGQGWPPIPLSPTCRRTKVYCGNKKWNLAFHLSRSKIIFTSAAKCTTTGTNPNFFHLDLNKVGEI